MLTRALAFGSTRTLAFGSTRTLAFGSTLMLAFGSTLFVPTAAMAAEPEHFGAKGSVVVGAERLFGVSWSSIANESTTAGVTTKSTTTRTNVGALWSYPTTVHNTPRLGIDYLVIQNLSVGFGAGYFTTTSQREVESSASSGVTTKTDGPTVATWLVAPRVGYALDLGPTMALWLRAGVTFYGASNEQTDESGGVTRKATLTTTGTAFAFEPTFVYSPAAHFGLYGGLALDAPLAGKSKSESTTTTGAVTSTTSGESDTLQASYGAVFGLLGSF